MQLNIILYDINETLFPCRHYHHETRNVLRILFFKQSFLWNFYHLNLKQLNFLDGMNIMWKVNNHAYAPRYCNASLRKKTEVVLRLRHQNVKSAGFTTATFAFQIWSKTCNRTISSKLRLKMHYFLITLIVYAISTALSAVIHSNKKCSQQRR